MANKAKEQRSVISPPGMETRVGVGIGYKSSNRCRARHDVPYTLRCVHTLVWDERRLDYVHEGKHKDKTGGEWE
jgi:hypothetical protein